MDCSDFRQHHLAYVDDTLPGDVLVAAERHRVECAACSAHDTLVRRSLLLARNLPSIEPSPDFTARLEARLREVQIEGRPVQPDLRWSDAGWSEARWYERLAQDAGGWGRQAVAAAVVLAAVSAGYALRGERAVTPNGALPGALATTAPQAPASVPAGSSATGVPLGAGPAFGAAALGATEVAAVTAGMTATGAAVASGAAARATGTGRAARANRGHVADHLMATHDVDDLGAPAYIPLPTGVLEANALLGPASAGIPVWAAALLAGEAPTQLRSAAPGAPTVRLVGLSH